MKAALLSTLALMGQALAAANPTATSASDVFAAQATAVTSHKFSHVDGAVFDRFVTIWLENTDYDKAAADPDLAWLAQKGITLSNYYGVTHPSEPNYVASIGGDYFGIDNDNFNQVDQSVFSVVDLLEDKSIEWATYQEDMPYSGYQGMAWVNQNTKANDYVRKHHPTIIYNRNITPERLAKQKNLTEFYTDLKADKLPQWMFITPNMTSDGHDTSVTTAGSWTRDFLTPLLNDPKSNFWKRTLVLITFDETHTYTLGNRVYSILLGDAVPSDLVGTTDSKFYNHYSEISTVEANWGLHTLGRWDTGANVFSNVAAETGDVYRPYDAVTSSSETVFLNSSTPGPFNSVAANVQTYNAPNLCIVSPDTGRTVLPAIKKAWANSTQTVYTDSVQIPDGSHVAKAFTMSCNSNGGRGQDGDDGDDGDDCDGDDGDY
ncbi:hypothetical protein AMS68_002759 [Peltaster fructicola]|uniref:Acid phosphatase n=1 Tax=Peltaster fructicola TaxID=286661 RepID=A0A6H0XR45_9PEZI|nr:hypothetical protein AMS68_002759 [Peltaster fructicola]